jgi:hypothetical protein
MKGAEQFVKKNFKGNISVFESCIHSIVYGYLLLSKSQIYSRKKILNLQSTVRGKTSRVVELEDFLRNDLVNNFIEPNLQFFNLENYLFIPGAEQSYRNVKTGVLDIKVCSPSFRGSVYYIFECKRLNKEILNGYLDEGIHRFVSNKYYPENATALGGMISFLEADKPNYKIDISTCFKELDFAIKKKGKYLGLSKSLSRYPIGCKTFKEVAEYNFVFHSSHIRKKRRSLIELYHIVLDYNSLITP